MTIKDICRLARENDITISIGSMGHSFAPSAVNTIDIRKDDYHITRCIPTEVCESEGFLEQVIEVCIVKIKEYEKEKGKKNDISGI